MTDFTSEFTSAVGDSETPLKMATRLYGDDAEITKALKDAIKNSTRQTAAQIAGNLGHTEFIKVLAERYPQTYAVNHAIAAGLQSSDPAVRTKIANFEYEDLIEDHKVNNARSAGRVGNIRALTELAQKDPKNLREAIEAGLRGTDPEALRRVINFIATNQPVVLAANQTLKVKKFEDLPFEKRAVNSWYKP